MKLYGVAVAYLIGALLVAVLPLEAMLSRCGMRYMAAAVRPAVMLCLSYSAGAVFATNRRGRGGEKR